MIVVLEAESWLLIVVKLVREERRSWVLAKFKFEAIILQERPFVRGFGNVVVTVFVICKLLVLNSGNTIICEFEEDIPVHLSAITPSTIFNISAAFYTPLTLLLCCLFES